MSTQLDLPYQTGSATPSANNDSLTLGFRERTKALHFSGPKIILLVQNHSHTTTSSLLTTCSTTAGSESKDHSKLFHLS